MRAVFCHQLFFCNLVSHSLTPSLLATRFTKSYRPYDDKLQPNEEGHRFTRSKCLGTCEAQLSLRRSAKKETDEAGNIEWRVTSGWRVTDVRNVHRCKLASSSKCFSTRLSANETQDVYEAKKAGLGVSQLINLLQNKHDTFITAADISNAFHKAKETYKDGRTDAQVLIDQLNQAGIHYEVCTDIMHVQSMKRSRLEPSLTTFTLTGQDKNCQRTRAI